MSRSVLVKLPGYDAALRGVLAWVPVLGVESVSLAASRGRVLREAVRADRDQPPFDRCAMDGVAVCSAAVQPGAWHAIDGRMDAGGDPRGYEVPLASGAARRVATGAPLPRGADAVIPIEQAQVHDASPHSAFSRDPQGSATAPRSADDPAPNHVRFDVASVKAWQNVHRRASDARAGDAVIDAGVVVGPQHTGIAAAVGATVLRVSQRPRITLLTTGDEVLPPDTSIDALAPHQIRNSNGPMLAMLLEAMGMPMLRHVHVPDEPEPTLAACREALASSHLVVTAGGVSAGERDWLPRAWSQLGLHTLLHGVAIQPGKPVFVAVEHGAIGADGIDAGRAANDNLLGSSPPSRASRMVLGLPGNPVSVLATAHLFLWPILSAMVGMARTLPWVEVTLGESVRSTSKRELFRAARLGDDGWAYPLAWQGSGDLMHTAGADGWLRLPQCEGEVEAGTRLAMLPMLR